MTSAKELGERQIIELFLERFQRTPDMVVPFGDDVAGIALTEETIAVLKTDILVGATDVPPTMTLRQAARKAVVMNVSDFAAKGVHPRALLVAVTIPRDYTRAEIEAIGDGLNAGAEEHNTYIIGGDTSEGLDLTICCMVFGVATRDTLMLRRGARPGDVLAVTGLFGKTSAGLRILMEGHDVPLGLRKPLVDSVYYPTARLREGLALAQTRVVTAAIDSSDGLAICLHELQKNSGIGLDVTTVPIAPEAREFATRHEVDPEALALYGGEEYELVVTVKPKGWPRAVQAVAEVGGTLMAIGHVVEGSEVTQRSGPDRKPIPRRGWEHFKHPA